MIASAKSIRFEFLLINFSKFTNVFGSSRLLGSLSLSPPGIRRQDNKEGAKVSLAKEREVSIADWFIHDQILQYGRPTYQSFLSLAFN